MRALLIATLLLTACGQDDGPEPHPCELDPDVSCVRALPTIGDDTGADVDAEAPLGPIACKPDPAKKCSFCWCAECQKCTLLSPYCPDDCR